MNEQKHSYDDILIAPQTKQKLNRQGKRFVTEDGQHIYPIIFHVPVLLPSTEAAVWHRELVELILWEHPDEIEKIYANEKAWRKDPKALYCQTIRRVIGGKTEIQNAADRYAAADTGMWLPKKMKKTRISFSSKVDFLKYASAKNGKRRMQTALHSIHKDAYSYYGSLISDCHPNKILELSTGAGTGTSLAVSAIPDDAQFFTTDIDFACLGSTVGIANFHRKAVIPVCANFWYLPFRNRSFDLVCTMNGLDESREIQRTLSQVRNMLKPGGFFLVFSRKNAYMRQRGILSEFGFTEAETLELLHKCRMYSSAEHLVELCALNGLEVKSQKEFICESNLTWVVSRFQMVDENRM